MHSIFQHDYGGLFHFYANSGTDLDYLSSTNFFLSLELSGSRDLYATKKYINWTKIAGQLDFTYSYFVTLYLMFWFDRQTIVCLYYFFKVLHFYSSSCYVYQTSPPLSPNGFWVVITPRCLKIRKLGTQTIWLNILGIIGEYFK